MFFTDLGGKFKFSAQDSDLEYLFWQCKNHPVSSDIKPPLKMEPIFVTSAFIYFSKFSLNTFRQKSSRIRNTYMLNTLFLLKIDCPYGL
jgi:hypothetical protein